MSERIHAIVTGGSSGIGAAVVTTLLDRGLDVTVLDLQHGGDPRAAVEIVDLVDETAVAAALDRAAERSGVATVLGACAGIRGQYVPALELELERMRQVFEVNLLGTLVPSRELVKRLDGRPGSVVAVSSTTAYGGWPNQGDYGPSKAAISNLVQVLAIEWAPLDVRVNAVAPSHTMTPMVRDLVAGGYDLEPVLARIPLGRIATPEEMANEIVHLALDAGFVTGQVLPVDGGWTAVGK